MEGIGEIISRMLAREGLRNRSREGPIYELWPRIVGELLCQKCNPVSVRKGVLLVQVEDSVWMHELQMQKYQILEKVWQLIGEGVVTDIRWTLKGRGPSGPRRFSRPTPEPPPSRPLTQDEAAWVEAVSAQVQDRELCAAIRKALISYLHCPKRGKSC